ncbi:MAG: NUDE protein, C-terminal conserved region [Phormidesmis priestleyi Ana]|uniref:NUDE protein, C-terminal conserved region n=1 Tax=Phormidesmis priestleyi Ana TaxID=1666911 RepID=A0A0P8BP76_9CYAN|nr:MAG: NUDE protein, C-terminal conserved region [Phormidesmis priestleyi Ana]
MDRHSHQPNQPLKPLAEEQVNLTQVRQNLTESPQTVFSVFKLSPTPYGLEMRMPLNRIRGSLIDSMRRSRSDQSTLFSLWKIIGMALVVGASVTLTKSAVFGGIVAVVLPLLLWLTTRSDNPSSQTAVILRLVNAPNGSTFLSMSTTPASSCYQRSASGHIPSRLSSGLASRSDLYAPYTYSVAEPSASTNLCFSNLPVERVSTSTSIGNRQISFTLYCVSPSKGKQIRISGSREEIYWLHAGISKWGKGLKEERERKVR